MSSPFVSEFSTEHELYYGASGVLVRYQQMPYRVDDYLKEKLLIPNTSARFTEIRGVVQVDIKRYSNAVDAKMFGWDRNAEPDVECLLEYLSFVKHSKKFKFTKKIVSASDFDNMFNYEKKNLYGIHMALEYDYAMQGHEFILYFKEVPDNSKPYTCLCWSGDLKLDGPLPWPCHQIKKCVEGNPIYYAK